MDIMDFNNPKDPETFFSENRIAILDRSFPGIVVRHQPVRGFDIGGLVLDAAKMKSLCSSPTIGIEEGFRRTHAWLAVEESPGPRDVSG